jgi:hypothetical protein
MPKFATSQTPAPNAVVKHDERMTPEQEEHLARIKGEFIDLVDIKYRRGQEEHGGNLHHVPAVAVLSMAIDEAIDQVTYLLTLREILQGGLR